MNNAFLNVKEEKPDVSALLQEQVTQLTDVVEAIQNVAGSNYWKVLKKNVFDVDLAKARRSLVKANDTTEIFRLQGEIRWGEKFNLEKLLLTKRNELQAIKKKINE